MKTLQLLTIGVYCFLGVTGCSSTEGNPAGQSIEDTNDVRNDMNDESDYDGTMNDMDTMDAKDYPGDSL